MASKRGAATKLDFTELLDDEVEFIGSFLEAIQEGATASERILIGVAQMKLTRLRQAIAEVAFSTQTRRKARAGGRPLSVFG
jgi:hypothetical protein